MSAWHGGKGGDRRPEDEKKFSKGFDGIDWGKCLCGGVLKPGKYIQQTLVGGTPDFPGDKEVVTLSPGGTGRLADCNKCDKCGKSIT